MSLTLTERLAARVRHDDVELVVRAVPGSHPDTRDHLLHRAHAFVTGAHLYGRAPDDPHRALVRVPAAYRGFAYEGAGLVAALADLAGVGTRGRLRLLLDGDGSRYRHLVHVGAGWALSIARLPHPPVLVGLDPLLRWLALDGWGFHRQFFDPSGTLDRLWRLPATDRNQLRAAGVGRALWFTRACDLASIRDDITHAPQAFAASLWSGVGLAACYAGRPEPISTAELLEQAGPSVGALGQGALFGAAATAAHGLPFTASQVQLLAGFGWQPWQATSLTEEASADLATAGAPVSAMELWRARLRAGASVAGVGLRGGPTDA